MHDAPPRLLAALGDPQDINCWSNIPYFFLHAGKKAGLFSGGLAIDTGRRRREKTLWNLASIFRGERPGGFQYSRTALDPFLQEVQEGCEIISHFQLFPSPDLARARGIRYWMYIDFPLTCLFRDYGIGRTIGGKIREQALERERELYRNAEKVFCMSEWARQRVIEECGIAADKTGAILPGANLPDEVVERSLDRHETENCWPDGKSHPLRIVFVGKDSQRKGLARLVKAIQIVRQDGYDVRLLVVGAQVENADPAFIEEAGFVDKAQDPERLVRLLTGCHLGALPSHQEALGIAAREFLRCGLPSLLTKTGGLAESVPDGCAASLPPDCSPEEIASEIQHFLTDPDVLRRMTQRAREHAREASWARTAQAFQQSISLSLP